MSLVLELLKVLLAFGAVAAAAYAASRLLGERWRGAAAGRRLQLLEVLPLGPRRQVCLVRVGEEDVVCLGVGEGGITALLRLRGPRARALLGEGRGLPGDGGSERHG